MSAATPPTTYLDHAASSPLRPEVAEAMAPFAHGGFGNPTGSHHVAREARRAMEEAREVVAELLGAAPGEIVFTSGGTEAANLAVLGTLAARHEAGRPGGAVICSAVEHAAVLESCRAAARSTASLAGLAPLPLRVAPVDGRGMVDLAALEDLVDDGVALVSVMLANNEVGTIQPLDGVVDVVGRAAPGAVVHTDAVQAATYLNVAVVARRAALVSISAHKLGGPKGVGALVVREPAVVRPILYGGGQERERRSGTPDVAGIVGLAAALRAAAVSRQADAARVAGLRDRFAASVVGCVPGAVRTVDPATTPTLPGHCHLSFSGVEQEELLVLLDERGVCASAGSSCASGALEPSHVLAAMGLPDEYARGAVRFTLGYSTGTGDVERAVPAVREAVALLRD
jgi:cysteine desulfurase